jgi:imidazole glycerol-phosphate synthase subunit HisF
MISIVDTGISNIASVRSALRHLGLAFQLISDPDQLRLADRILLPGVGSFDTGMRNLNRNGLTGVLSDKIVTGTPTLAICLGLQLLCDGSDEAPGVPGLGVIPGVCRALPDSVRIPQQGWNHVTGGICEDLTGPGFVAYANSFALPAIGEDWRPSFTTYGEQFVAAVYRDGLFACQFHPELSGSYGLGLIKAWMNGIDEHQDDRVNPGPDSESISSTVRVIPCLDVAHGRVVKGIRFENLRDAGDPAELAARYESEGADEVVLLDITASPGGVDTQLDTVRRVREQLHIPLTIGGGIRSLKDATNVLASGADKISVNSAAVLNPELITELSGAFGRQCIVVAIDTRRSEGGWEVLINGGRVATDLSATAWAVEAANRGAGEILLTSWDKDGTLEGPDIELMESVSSAVSIPVVCSGGIGTAEDASRAVCAGADAVLAASIFHDRAYSIDNFKTELNDLGVVVRL